MPGWAGQMADFLTLLRTMGLKSIPVSEQDPVAALVEGVADCRACRLSRTVGNKVFGQGPVPCPVMLVGEAPGADEDKTGIPFVGRAGQLLDKILAAVQMKREDVYLANVIKCRPPENRSPLPDEVDACMPFLWRQIDVVNPVFIVAMGAVAARNLLGMEGALSRMRGRFYRMDGRFYMVTYHPAALLRNERYKRPAWEDWKMFRAAFNEYKASGDLPRAEILERARRN